MKSRGEVIELLPRGYGSPRTSSQVVLFFAMLHNHRLLLLYQQRRVLATFSLQWNPDVRHFPSTFLLQRSVRVWAIEVETEATLSNLFDIDDKRSINSRNTVQW